VNHWFTTMKKRGPRPPFLFHVGHAVSNKLQFVPQAGHLTPQALPDHVRRQTEVCRTCGVEHSVSNKLQFVPQAGHWTPQALPDHVSRQTEVCRAFGVERAVT
jgi:hypothetical protein